MEVRIRLGKKGEQDRDSVIMFSKFEAQKTMITQYFRFNRNKGNKLWFSLATTALDHLLPLYLKYLEITKDTISFDDFLKKIETEGNLEKIVEITAHRDRASKIVKL